MSKVEHQDATVLSDDGLRALDAPWRAANHPGVGQICLMSDALPTEPVTPEHIKLPGLAVRVVNVVDLARLLPREEHLHGMGDFEYDGLFTTGKPVIFAHHGHPWLIHRLSCRRTGHADLHVRGHKEMGTTTTPFGMVVRNDMDVIDRVPEVADWTWNA